MRARRSRSSKDERYKLGCAQKRRQISDKIERKTYDVAKELLGAPDVHEHRDGLVEHTHAKEVGNRKTERNGMGGVEHTHAKEVGKRNGTEGDAMRRAHARQGGRRTERNGMERNGNGMRRARPAGRDGMGRGTSCNAMCGVVVFVATRARQAAERLPPSVQSAERRKSMMASGPGGQAALRKQMAAKQHSAASGGAGAAAAASRGGNGNKGGGGTKAGWAKASDTCYFTTCLLAQRVAPWSHTGRQPVNPKTLCVCVASLQADQNLEMTLKAAGHAGKPPPAPRHATPPQAPPPLRARRLLQSRERRAPLLSDATTTHAHAAHRSLSLSLDTHTQQAASPNRTSSGATTTSGPRPPPSTRGAF